MIEGQRTLFEFDTETTSNTSEPMWMMSGNGHRGIYRTDAEALAEDLGKMPSGKGLWIRCLLIEKDKPYEKQFNDWDARIWQQRGIGTVKLVRCNGDVRDCIDPHPMEWHWVDGHQIRPYTYEDMTAVWIDGDVLHFTTKSGEYMCQIIPDSEADKYDMQPYRPNFDLEHFAIECYRNGIPPEMMEWRKHYLFGTPVMKPYICNIDEDDARKIDPMGNIPNAYIRNPQFDQICDCADAIGIELELDYIVPPLDNPAMYPCEQNCKSCLKYKKNVEGCGEGNNSYCSNWIWNRKTKAQKKSKISKECEDDECEE